MHQFSMMFEPSMCQQQQQLMDMDVVGKITSSNSSLSSTSCCPASPATIVDEMHQSYYRMMRLNYERQQHFSLIPTTSSARFSNNNNNNNTNNNNNNNNNNLHKQPKRVSFAEEALLYSGDVTLEEVHSSWYNAQEYQAFKKERKDAIRIIKKNGFKINELEQAGFCLRGFEPYFSLEINRGIKHARETAVRNVLREQQRQLESGAGRDEEAVRARYAQATQWIRINAIQLGANDAAAVRHEREQARLAAAIQQQRPQQHYHDIHVAPDNRPPLSMMRMTPPPLGSYAGFVSTSNRNEFVQTTALHRERSSRQLLIDQELDLEMRHVNGIMKKLENALQLVGKIDLNDNSNHSSSHQQQQHNNSCFHERR